MVAKAVEQIQAPPLEWQESVDEHVARLAAWQVKMGWRSHSSFLHKDYIKPYREMLSDPANLGQPITVRLGYQYTDRKHNSSELMLLMGIVLDGTTFRPMTFTEFLRARRAEKMIANNNHAYTVIKQVTTTKFHEHTLLKLDDRSYTKSRAEWTPAKARLLSNPQVTARQVRDGQKKVEVEFRDDEGLIFRAVLDYNPFHGRDGDPVVIGGDRKLALLFPDPPDKILARHLVVETVLPEDPICCTVDAKQLTEAVAAAEKASKETYDRPELGKMLLRFGDDKLTVAASDTYRLLLADIPAAGSLSGMDMLVSPLGLKTALKGLKGDLKMAWESRRLYLSKDGVNAVAIPFTTGKFIKFENAIPKAEVNTSAKVLASDLLDGCNLMGIVGKEDANRVVLSLHEGEDAKLSAHAIRDGDMLSSYALPVQTDHRGEPFQIAFNYRYVMDFVDRVKKSTGRKKGEAEVTMEFWGPKSPMRLAGADLEYFVMPMDLLR